MCHVYITLGESIQKKRNKDGSHNNKDSNVSSKNQQQSISDLPNSLHNRRGLEQGCSVGLGGMALVSLDVGHYSQLIHRYALSLQQAVQGWCGGRGRGGEWQWIKGGGEGGREEGEVSNTNSLPVRHDICSFMHSCITHIHTPLMWPSLQHLLYSITCPSYLHRFSCAIVVKLKQQSQATIHDSAAAAPHTRSTQCTGRLLKLTITAATCIAHTWGEWQLPHTHRQTPRSRAALWEPPQTAMPCPHEAGRLQMLLTSSNPRPEQQHRHR